MKDRGKKESDDEAENRDKSRESKQAVLSGLFKQDTNKAVLLFYYT